LQRLQLVHLACDGGLRVVGTQAKDSTQAVEVRACIDAFNAVQHESMEQVKVIDMCDSRAISKRK
jgi:hypothetical protein